MKFLRIFLSLVLIFCITWGFIIFAGPFLINQWAKYYFNNQVELRNISVSSRLDVAIEEINFELDGRGYPQFSGHARAANLDWSLLGGKISTTIRFGPITLLNYGSVKALELTFYSGLGFGLIEPNIELSILDLKAPNTLYARELNFKGKLDDEITQVFDISTAINEISFFENGSVTIPSLIGQVDRFYLSSPLDEQNGQMKLFIDKGHSSELDFLFKNTELLLSQKSGRLALKGRVESASSPRYSLKINSLEFLGDLNLSQKDSTIEVDLQMNKFEHFNENLELSNLQISLAGKSGSLDVWMVGNVDRLEIWNKSSFVAKLDDAKFEQTIKLRKIKEVNKIIGSMELAQGQDAMLAADASFSLEVNSSLKNCMTGTCPVGQVEIEYFIKAEAEQLEGLALCGAEICKKDSFEHSISTSDTSAFLAASGRSGVFNPIFLLMAYNSLVQGDRIGMGHELNF